MAAQDVVCKQSLSTKPDARGSPGPGEQPTGGTINAAVQFQFNEGWRDFGGRAAKITNQLIFGQWRRAQS